MWGHTAYDWNTMLRSRRSGWTRIRRSVSLTTLPPMATAPRVGVSIPASIRRIVDLPQPLGPRRVTNSPVRIEKLTPASAVTAPNFL